MPGKEGVGFSFVQQDFGLRGRIGGAGVIQLGYAPISWSIISVCMCAPIAARMYAPIVVASIVVALYVPVDDVRSCDVYAPRGSAILL